MTDPSGQPPKPRVITSDMLEEVDSRVEFERGMSYLPRLTLGLIALNVAVFIWEIARGALESRETIIGAGALERTQVFREGEFWRLATAPFLHGGVDHLIGNLLMLWVVGMALEHALGATRMLWVYSAAGLAGSLLSAAVNQGPSVGASGAIFGVMTGVMAVLHRHRHRITVRERRIALVLGAWTVWQILNGFVTPMIDNMAHIGGAIGGALVAWNLEPVLFEEA